MEDKTTILQKLHLSRHELLDLGLRNPLLNYRYSPSRGVQVVGEDPAQVLEVLLQGKALTFVPAPEPGTASKPEADFTSANPPKTALADTRLQTAEPAQKLEKRLLNTYYAYKTSLEEQGVNILYLALGLVHWYEADAATEPRFAPLVLVPVELERTSARERFKLKYSGAEVETNLSLQAKLKTEFGIALPQLIEGDELNLPDYFRKITEAIQHQPRWKVSTEAVSLGFFSFGKFLLYRDLDLSLWPDESHAAQHPILNALLGDGFREPQPSIGEDAFLDDEPATHELHQVLDADSSQLLALLAVQEGRNLVVQGPPGTGKSQTITNLLAEAIGAGKRVLFVAEKMAALEVVKRRLDSLGLGNACLELHSHKANKKALHHELKQTLALHKPVLEKLQQEVALLEQHRNELNAYAAAANEPIGQSGKTPFQVMGELLQIHQEKAEVELPRITLANLPNFTGADMQRLLLTTERLQALVQKTGRPKQLAFWGSKLKVLLPALRDALSDLIQQATISVRELQQLAAETAAVLCIPQAQTRAETEITLTAAKLAQQAPELPGVQVQSPLWLQKHSTISSAIEAAENLQQLKKNYAQFFTANAWAYQNLQQLHQELTTHGGKFWNFLIGSYKKAVRELQGLALQPLPKENDQQITLVNQLRIAQQHRHTMQQHSALLQELFGPNWQQENSDFTQLKRIANYLKQVHEAVQQKRVPVLLLSCLATQNRPALLPEKTNQLAAALELHLQQMLALTEKLELDETIRFGADGRLFQQPFAQQLKVLTQWQHQLPELQLVLDWNNLAAVARQDGIPELVTLAETWPHAGTHLVLALRQLWLEHLLQMAYNQREALRKFERTGHEEAIKKFREADEAQLQYNRARAALAHWEKLPRHEAGGQLGVLKTEFNKKARHLPIRRLMEQAGLAIQTIKPVFMMSPLSIANFLPPGALEFDLVVFDEASQVKPVEALGAILRGKQLVVVGDSKQLPPTSFFDSLTDTEALPEEEESVTADMESILGLCEAKQAPTRMLRWHYRSKHDSLIRVSNHEFYDNGLVVFPSPQRSGKLGLHFRHLPETAYERGTSRTNPLEAEAVADAVVKHIQQHPELTLGVATFSTAQRQAIEDALEQKRRADPSLEEYFSAFPFEPFFVKNLENVQGDERDVIFISMGYGRTKEGYLAMNFGPLNAEGGERRLNVLITRARLHCVVFSNFTSADLDLARTNARGVQALKSFLHFAEHLLLQTGQETGMPFGSPFEEQVHQALIKAGYQVRPQIGAQGFFIDLAIVDPEQPGRYLLGIECDGAQYHSARSARDRDRLRQQVLEGLGWQIHRIWSTDWFRNPEKELRRTAEVIEQAKARAAEKFQLKKLRTQAAPELQREQETEVRLQALPAYELAQLPAAVAQKELHLHSLHQLAVWITEVVRVESPVHEEETIRRIAAAAGVSRIGNRIRLQLERAARLAINTGSIRKEGDFLWMANMRNPPLRERSNLPASARKFTLIDPAEMQLALQEVVRQSFGISPDEVAAATARLLGFGRLTEELRQQLNTLLQQQLEQGKLEEKNGFVQLTF